MTQMQTLMERMQEDYEFRFQQLEGGSSGKTDAVPQSGGAMPSGGVPQNQNSEGSDAIDLTGPEVIDNGGDGDFLIDPAAEGFDLGSPDQPLGTLNGSDLNVGGQPLDLTFDSGGLVTDDDATAQFKAGYEAAQRGDYAFAEDQFRQFIGLFPDHPQAPEATNWLGETLIQRGEYDEAADILLTGYQSYSNSQRAPDLLFKLGVALAGAGERDTACRTFVEVGRRYPESLPSLQSRVAQEMAKAQC
jgi:tol-pal system protein YbgF